MRIICKHNTDGCSICEGELAIALEALEEAQGELDAAKRAYRDSDVVDLERILSKEGE